VGLGEGGGKRIYKLSKVLKFTFGTSGNPERYRVELGWDLHGMCMSSDRDMYIKVQFVQFGGNRVNLLQKLIYLFVTPRSCECEFQIDLPFREMPEQTIDQLVQMAARRWCTVQCSAMHACR
jgi:hypothetical protein